MTSYCLKLTPHYSGFISAHFPDIPGLVVLGRDQQEATEVAREALVARLKQRQAEGACLPRPSTRGAVMVSVAGRRPDESATTAEARCE